MGGKWNRKAKAHVFGDDPAERLDEAILTMSYERPKDYGFFPTPPQTVELLMREAEIGKADVCLEPSAGHGAIAEAMAKIVGQERVTTVELLPENCEILRAKGFHPFQSNFLHWATDRRFDVIVMNPPFAKQEDLAHVLHAYTFLKPGGRLVSVMSCGMTFRMDRRAIAFRNLLNDRGGRWEDLPEEAFKASGTMVRTVMVILDKPRDD